MKPLLSIVIPTKDRYEYLIQLIELIESFKSDDIEIVIQDNTKENKDILSFVHKRLSENFRYSHVSEQLTISENSDRAIRNSTGEYVCFLGDDDGTTKEILTVVRWMKQNAIDAAITSPTYYKWPNAYDGGNALLEHSSRLTGNYNVMRSDVILNKCLKDGFTWRDGLPGVYHGIVKREVLDKIYSKCNSYFPGPSPDIANCVAVCLVTEKYGFIDKPIIINGAGWNHGGGAYRKDISLRKLPFLPDNIIDSWNRRIPRAWTATTIWCESAVKALSAMNRNDLVDKVNYNYMYAVFFSLYYSEISRIINVKPNIAKFIFNLTRRFFKIVRKRLNGLIYSPIQYKNVQDIIQASKLLTDSVKL